jgi:hypothetical protein
VERELTDDEKENIDGFAAKVRTMISGEYGEVRSRVVALHAAFHRELAAALAPMLNEHIAKMPQATLEEKRALATWLNAELRGLGLAIRFPGSNEPAILVADFKNSAHRDATRFRLHSRDVSHRKTRTAPMGVAPELELMADPPRRENFARLSTREKDERGR